MRRALIAGALALAVIAPAIDLAGNPAEAGTPPLSMDQNPESTRFGPFVTLVPGRAAERASRSAGRRTTPVRATIRPAASALRAAAQRSATRETARISAVREIIRSRIRAVREAAQSRRDQQLRRATAAARWHRSTAPRQRRSARSASVGRSGSGMSAVLSYARSQIGKSYVNGGEGPYSFDCSGFTKRAYARAGLRLPHSSGAQAARARRISRHAARAGDLVVGSGHVGIYMGDGMMIDAGNSRVGVTYRKLYDGLWIERF